MSKIMLANLTEKCYHTLELKKRKERENQYDV